MSVTKWNPHNDPIFTGINKYKVIIGTPINKKVYTRDFLLEYKNICTTKPKNFPNMEFKKYNKKRQNK